MALFQRVRSPFTDDEPEAPTTFKPEDESVGELLRRQRTEMGLHLLEVAAALKIKPAYLAAIEGGRLDQLPGAPYAVGFVRSYSDYLRLHTVEILLRFKLEAAGLDAKPDLTFPMPLGERSVPAGRIMIVAVILAICGYGGWYYISTVDRRMPERIAEVPAELVGARPEPGSASKSPPPKPAGNLAQTRETVAPTNVPGSTRRIVKPSETSPKADPSPNSVSFAGRSRPDGNITAYHLFQRSSRYHLGVDRPLRRRVVDRRSPPSNGSGLSSGNGRHGTSPKYNSVDPAGCRARRATSPPHPQRPMLISPPELRCVRMPLVGFRFGPQINRFCSLGSSNQGMFTVYPIDRAYRCEPATQGGLTSWWTERLRPRSVRPALSATCRSILNR